MLTAKKISFAVRGRDILKEVSVQIKPGRFTTVVGPNGAGKSTLLRILSNELCPSQGMVTLNGNTLHSYHARALSQVRSVLPQHTQVQFAFTVSQIVQLGRQHHPSLRSESAAIINEVMELTGVMPYKDRIYRTLSGGERQRVQLARVLAQVWEQTVFPRYLLLDEPTSSLDIAQQDVIFSLARAACERNIGVLAIIHDLNQAVQFADDMLFLRDGRAVAYGQSATVFTQSTIEATFDCAVDLYHFADREHPFVVPRQGTHASLSLAKTRGSIQ